MGLFRGFLVVAFFAILGAACKPQPTFPTTPALTFKEFIQPAGSDSLRVVFHSQMVTEILVCCKQTRILIWYSQCMPLMQLAILLLWII